MTEDEKREKKTEYMRKWRAEKARHYREYQREYRRLYRLKLKGANNGGH